MASTSNTMIKAANQAQDWIHKRPRLMDVGFALLVLVVGMVDLIASNDDPGVSRQLDALAITLVALGALALIRRRQNPVGVLLVISTLMFVFYVRDYGSFMSIVGLAAFYAAAAHATNRRLAWSVMVVSGVGLFGVAVVTLLDRPNGFDYSGAAAMSSSICLATFIGVVARNREQIFVQAEARADRAEADRAAAAERAATQERLRIAREMHDVVAHGMSVIAVQAAAAQEIAHHDPDRAVELMKTVETTGRESLNEMRRMLGVLRNNETSPADADTGRRPQPAIADIAATIGHCRDAGLPTEFTVHGQPHALSPGLELTIFRIVQEALTNVLKHGGSKAEANVELRYESTAVVVSVTDTGRGLLSGANGATTGNGLRGMRERVDLYDGTVQAGPRAGGGYEVRAELPHINAVRPKVPSADASSSQQAAGQRS